MKSSNSPAWAIDINLVHKAANVYSRGKWGDICLGEPVPVFGMPSNYPRAYVFPVGLNGKKPDVKSLITVINRYATQFAKDYSALTNLDKEGKNSRVVRTRLEKSRQSLVFSKKIGTIVISASKVTHPVLMAYEGHPFSITAPRVISALSGVERLLPNTNEIILRMDDNGSPIYFELQTGAKNKKLISAYDFKTPYIKQTSQSGRSPWPVERERNYRTLWAFIAKLKSNYIAKVSPRYIADSVKKGESENE